MFSRIMLDAVYQGKDTYTDFADLDVGSGASKGCNTLNRHDMRL